MKTRYVFISYSTSDIKEAEIVREVLSEKGIICWMSPESIPFGSNYSTEIFDAISDCFVFVLLLSKESMNSVHVSKELDLAVCNRKLILPLKLDSEEQTHTFRYYLCNVKVMPVESSIRLTAEQVACFILERGRTNSGNNVRLVQKYEKPSVSILPNREAMSRLDQLFQVNNVVCISGMGGMGKSELAKSYVKLLMEQNRLETVSYNDCPGSIRQTISMIPFEGIEDEKLIEEGGQSQAPEDVESVLFEKKYALLKTMKPETLLVFDGLNQLDYEGMEALDRLNCRVLVTTRFHFDEYPELRMEDVLPFEKQKALFLQYYEDYTGSDEDEAYIERIIRDVGGHILTIKLIALFLNTTGMTPEELYGKLIKKGAVALDTSEKVSYRHSYQTIEAHIADLFQMTNLSPEELRVLQQLSYIPSFGVPKRQFRLWTLQGTMAVVDQLIKKGWVQNNKGIIMLHPIIHSLIRKRRPDRLDELKDYFTQIIQYLDMKTITSIPERQNAAFLSAYLANEIDENSLTACQLLLALGCYLNHYTYWLLFGARNTNRFTYFTQAYNRDRRFLDQFAEAETCFKRGIEICRAPEIGNRDGILARHYSNLGATYFNMRRFAEAVSCHQTALTLRTEELGDIHPKTVTSRRRLGSSYLEMVDYDAAFACYHRNLELLAEAQANPEDLAKANFDCGKVFIRKGDSAAALPYLRCAVKELNKADPKQVDAFGAAQVFYMTAKILSEVDKAAGAEQAEDEILAFLRKAEEYAEPLDSAASDELIALIRALRQQHCD